MRWLLALACVMLAACAQKGDEAAVVLYDENYTLSVALDNADGITSPDGLLWREGALYIADEGGSAIRRWDGETLVTLADVSSGIASPEDLRFDAAGTLWFTDDTAGGVWRVTGSGAERADLPGDIGESEGLAVDPSGGVDVGDGANGRVFHVTATGEVEAYGGRRWGIAKPESMVRAPDGSLLVADNREDRLVRIGTDGDMREIALPAGLSPESIALDGDTVWITDSHNGRLYRMKRDQSPETVALFLGDFGNINGIAVAPGGTLYISVQSDLAAGEGYVLRLAPRKKVAR